MKRDPRVDAYINKASPFARPILKHLRKLVHAGCPDGAETIKWNMPHFEYHGLLCGMAAFKSHCAFWFWKRPLVLGPNSKRGMAQFGRLRSKADLPADRKLIGYVRKATEVNEAGAKSKTRSKPKKKSPRKARTASMLKRRDRRRG